VSSTVAVRAAAPGDASLLYSLIVGLAEYEREPDAVTGTQEMLEQALFGPTPSAEAVIAEIGPEPAGFALFHSSFSTWECRPGIWLEDLYVPPQHRRSGVGAVLLRHLAQLTVERGCARLEWAALTWNTPALDFYTKLGAERLEAWRMYRLDGSALGDLAGEPGSGGS
jgi:GNAT superfamily N-acetyltransferase